MRQRSEDREDFAGAFGPEGPSMPPPASNGPGQRRFDRMFALITGLVVLAIIAGMVVYFGTRGNPKPTPPPANPTKEVESAYLAFSAAQDMALLRYDIGLVASYLTPSGLQAEQEVLAYNSQQKARYQTSEDHDLQTVIYSGGVTASVDDNFLEHQTPVDPTTLASDGPEQTSAFQQSTVLTKLNGRWLVDSFVSFGGTGEDPYYGLSYAAKNRDTPLSAQARSAIEHAYLSYWNAYLQGFQSLSTASLANWAIDPALSDATRAIDAARTDNKAYDGGLEHNYRIAQKNAGTAYVYDTLLDDPQPFNPTTKQRLAHQPPTLERQTFELTKVGDLWKVDLIKGDY